MDDQTQMPASPSQGGPPPAAGDDTAADEDADTTAPPVVPPTVTPTPEEPAGTGEAPAVVKPAEGEEGAGKEMGGPEEPAKTGEEAGAAPTAE